MWTSDSLGLLGAPIFVRPVYSLLSLGPFSYGVIPSHHIIAGFLGLIVGPWHIATRPVSSSIAAVFFAAFITQASMWYSSGGTSALELFGPTRFQWDNAYFSQNIESRISSVDPVFLKKA